MRKVITFDETKCVGRLEHEAEDNRSIPRCLYTQEQSGAKAEIERDA